MITLALLAASPIWVAWQSEERNGDRTKVPYSPFGNGKAKADDARTWGTRAQAEARAERLPKPCQEGGIGLEFTVNASGQALGGVDLDTCRSKDGAIAPWAMQVIERLGTYSEVSPSGTGVKAFFTFDAAALDKLREMSLIEPGDGEGRKPGFGRKFANGDGKHAPAIEVHLGNRYFAVTDQHYEGTPIELRHVALEDLIWLLRDAGPAFAAATKRSKKPGGRDNTRSAVAFRKGIAHRRAGKSFEQMCKALRADPETADWYREKGEAAGSRELKRIWDRAGATTEEIDRLVAEFNDKYMVVNEAGRTIIYAPAEDPILHRRYYDRMRFGDLRQLYLNQQIEVGQDGRGNPILKPVAEIWLHHAERRQFIGGVTFDPSGKPTPEGTLNLWQGFAIQPRRGSWERLRIHVRDVICRGNREHYDYLMRWLARLVQRLAEQAEVAIVMRGAEGTGKGMLARAITRILGQHALAISNSKHLTGNFNAHLRDCVFLFADEAFYDGDRQHVGVLKSIITEPYLTIEGKYQNPVQTPNFLHLMMASNEEWVIPASLEARRFFVLEVSDARKDDHAWFVAIWEEMEAGGYEAMLHDLMQINLTTFNVRRVPTTDGLQQQKKLSLPTDKAWWLDVLHRGYVFRSRLGLEHFFGRWEEEATTELLYASYTEFAERHRERHPLSRERFGCFMVSLGTKPKRLSSAAIGEHVADVKTPYGTTRKPQVALHPRPPGYHLGTLETARAAFTTMTGLPIDWQDP